MKQRLTAGQSHMPHTQFLEGFQVWKNFLFG
jgi:hypothetical protein